MSISDLFKAIHDNITPILAVMTIISFIINLLQYKTKKDLGYFLDSIYHTCWRTVRRNEKVKKTNEELINTIFTLRTQAAAGLRSIGIKRTYGLYDQNIESGAIYSFCRSAFRLSMKIKEKLPLLIRKTNDGEEVES
jgi:hypothetical protein